MPGQSLDAREDLPKKRRRQVTFGQLTFGQLQDEVPREPK